MLNDQFILNVLTMLIFSHCSVVLISQMLQSREVGPSGENLGFEDMDIMLLKMFLGGKISWAHYCH